MAYIPKKKAKVITAKKTSAKPASSASAASASDSEEEGEDSDSKKKSSKKDLLARVNAGEFDDLVKQVETEYQYSYAFMKPWWDEGAVRLKLYNNQKRDKEAVGDPLLFTIQQTVLAALYMDRLGVSHIPKEEGDSETAEALDSLAEYDYDEMEKDILDYEWDWDTCFFGYGLIEFCEFDRKDKLPIPEVIDPMTFFRDPKAKSINGDRKGRGRMRFGGREVRMTKYELDDAGVYFNLKGIKADSTEIKSMLDQNAELRSQAQGFNAIDWQDSLQGDNKTYHILNWYTRWKGKLVLVGLADGRKRLIRYKELKGNNIPIIQRKLFPTAHDFGGVSIPDLVEDKQRARAIVQNLSLKGIKIGINPMYLYDQNKITNKNELNAEFNKYIGVNGNPTGSVLEMPRQNVKQEVGWIMDLLDQSSQRATATPEQQQGVAPDQRQTATQSNILDKKVDVRYSLAARIFGWSERRFWKQWYSLYKEYFVDGIDEKIIRLQGAGGVKFRPLRRENIIANTDPDVSVESRSIAETRRFNEFQIFRAYVQSIAQDPNSNMRYAEKHLGKLSGLKKDQIDMLLPPTVDELIAESENELLESGKLVEVNADDDHQIHLEVHMKASETPEKLAHIQAHIKALRIKKMDPTLFPATPSAQNPTQGGGLQDLMKLTKGGGNGKPTDVINNPR